MAKKLLLVASLVILAVQAAVQIQLASLDSPTTDESVHLSAGYTYLTRGDWRFNPEHPPLVKELAALPLLFLKPNLPPDAEELWQRSGNFFVDSWRENRTFGEELLYASGNNPDLLIFYARLPMIALTLLLGLTIFLIAWKHWGAGAAFVATALYAFNPTVNGHGHLVTTDIGLALGALLTIYTGYQLFKSPTWWRSIAFGLSLGLALLTKYTAAILLPILVVMMIVALLDKQRTSSRRLILGLAAAGLVVAWLTIWAGYGFHYRPVPKTVSVTSEIARGNRQAEREVYEGTSLVNDPKYSFTDAELDQVTTALKPKDRLYSLIRPVLIAFPDQYLKGLSLIFGHVSGGHESFFLGETTQDGHRTYFPLLFLFKNPLPTLLIILGGIYLLVRRRPRESLAVTFLASSILFLVVAMGSKANLGVRHILPIFPPLFLIGGWAVVGASQKIRLIGAGLVLWSALIFGLSYPTYLGYFNELVGGSDNGYKIATDSNLDWGQDLKRISRFIATNNIRKPFIEYGWLGSRALDYYLGKDTYHLLSSWQPGETGTAIIGATAINDPDYYFVADCLDKQYISSGTLVCRLGDTNE